MFFTLELVDILGKASGQGGEWLGGDMSHTNHAQVMVKVPMQGLRHQSACLSSEG